MRNPINFYSTINKLPRRASACSLAIFASFILICEPLVQAQADSPDEASLNVAFLTAVKRLNSDTDIDYYFSCNLIGTFLQWDYRNQLLKRFDLGPDNIRDTVVDSRANYSYTATLLSSHPAANGQAEMGSALVLSVTNDADPGTISVTCSSDHEREVSVGAGAISDVLYSNNTGETVRLEYLASGRIVGNREITHILLCGAKNPPQSIKASWTRPGITAGGKLTVFDNYKAGSTSSILERGWNAVEFLIILVSRIPQFTSLIFVVTNSDVTEVSCCVRKNCTALSVQKPITELPTLSQSTELSTELSTEFSTIFSRELLSHAMIPSLPVATLIMAILSIAWGGL